MRKPKISRTKEQGEALGEPNSGLEDRVWVSVKKRIDNGDYQGFEVSLGLSSSVLPGSTRKDTYEELLAECVKYLRLGLDVMDEAFD